MLVITPLLTHYVYFIITYNFYIVSTPITIIIIKQTAKITNGQNSLNFNIQNVNNTKSAGIWTLLLGKTCKTLLVEKHFNKHLSFCHPIVLRKSGNERWFRLGLLVRPDTPATNIATFNHLIFALTLAQSTPD